MELINAKGTKDYLPEEKIFRQEIVERIKGIFERYGYNPIETPILERYDILTAKFAAGTSSDVMKEIFTLKDQGGRELGLRYEFTFALARVIGMNPTLKMPFKRYQIGEIFRDGPLKLGRMRQFWQCDVDVVGISNVLADAEILALAQDVFKELQLEIVIEVNNRKLLNALLKKIGIAEKKSEDVLIILDKLKKIGKEEVGKELQTLGVSQRQIKELLAVLSIQGTNEEKFKRLKNFLGNDESTEEMESFFNALQLFDVEFSFNPSLVRGLAYYTGPIYEVILKNSSLNISVAGGGRWDNMIGNYLGTERNYPATGISFGLEPITEALKEKRKDIKKNVAQVYVIPIKTEKEAIACVCNLRKKGIKADIDLQGRGISKNLDYANALGIPFVLILGKEELSKKKFKLKDMKTGKEQIGSFLEITKNLIKK